jgi:chromosome segregation ATPase
VLDILHRELAAVLERIAEKITAIQQKTMNHELAQRIQSVKRMAMQRLQENARKPRKVYASEYAAKGQELRERYERLMQLANKISQQKAEIQEARSRLQKRLQDANKLHREFSEIGQTMSQQIGDLEGLVGDDTASPSKT